MKFLYSFFLLLCLVEIYGQRLRTTHTNQDVSTQEPKVVRGRGRSRFTQAAEEILQTSERPSTNRRASTRTRIHSNNPKAAADRRARPTEAPRSYAVEEINDDSPIESFRRQSKPRILTESRFEIPTVTVSRRPQNFETSRSSTLPPVYNEFPIEEQGFGSTARAILQARGETLPPKTTTPVVDEAYLLNNFGKTFRSLAASVSRNDVSTQREAAIQRATPLRSEVPILEREDIPSRRSSLRGDPLPSLKGSDVSLERQIPARRRKNGQANKVAEARTTARLESPRKTTEPTLIEEIARLETVARQETETDGPESVQGIFEQSDSITETQPFEASSEILLPEDEDLRKTSSAEVVTQRVTEPSVPRKSIENYRRNSARSRVEVEEEFDPTPASRSRTRAPRTRATQRSVEVTASSRTRGARRRYDDAAVAESRTRGPSVFTAEQYQEVTSRSRTGRRIDSRFEGLPERITVDLTPVTTRTRAPGRRATTTGIPPNERSSGRDTNNSRGRSRSRTRSEQSTFAPISRPSSRRSNSIDDSAFYGEKTSHRGDPIDTDGRKKSSSEYDIIEPRAPLSQGNHASVPSNRKETTRRVDSANTRSNDKAPLVNNRRESKSRFESPESDFSSSRANSRALRFDGERIRNNKVELPEARNFASRRNTYSRQSSTSAQAIPYGDRSLGTRANLPQTTTTTEESTTLPIGRSHSRFPDVPPKIDESKLEVLPLFERDAKTISSARSRGHRSRSSVNRRQNLPQDHMHVSATENDVIFVEKPTTSAFTSITVTRTESVEAITSRTRLSTRTASTTTSTTTKETTTRRPTSTTTITTTMVPETSAATKKWVTRSPPVIKETVIAEVNSVTSKSTITRRKKVPKAKAAEVLSRGAKKADVKLADIGKKKASSEEIDEEDNYPEPFKALIQAKKKKEEANPSKPTNTEKVFVTSEASPRGSAKVRVVTTEKPSSGKKSHVLNEIEESRPLQSSVRGAKAGIKSTSTEKVFVTSEALPRGSSTARVVTTELPSISGRRSQLLNEIVNDNDNELDPKSAISSTTSSVPTRTPRSRTLPKFSEKPKYTQKPREKYTKSITDKPKYSSEKSATKTTSTPRKTYSTKSYSTRAPAEHHSRRKALRSTALPPSTTPLNFVNREAKFSAKFIKKETKENNLKNIQPKGLFSSRKETDKETKEQQEKSGRKLDDLISQTLKPSLPIKKFNSSRYSSRYRSDASQRSTVLKSTTSAPFYIPTIPTPAYIPTVPTIAPSVTPVDGYVVEKDKDLGLEVISFDDPVNTIPSADLVNGEYLTTDKNIKLSPMVKDGTTEKAVSIIERIINSITSISTTAVPNITTTTNSPSSTGIGSTENSAILKLAPKKTTTKDKTIPDDQTNIIETITSEKPTTIIEKIRSSLSAIQSNEVGTPSEFNTVSSSSTTPLSTVTKYSAKFRGSSVGTTALPAPLPLSTSINPLNVFDEIDENQVLEKRTIGKLLNILNGLVSTNSPEGPEKLVVVTPKNVLNFGTSSKGFVTTFSPQEPLEPIILNGIEPRDGSVDSSTSVSDISLSSTLVNTETSSLGSTVNTESSTFSSVVNNDALGTETVSMRNTEISTTAGQMDTDTTTTVSTPTESVNTETNSPANTEMSTMKSTQTDSTTGQAATTTDLNPTTLMSSVTTTNTPEVTPNPLSTLSTISSTTATTSDTITSTPQPQATTNVDGIGSSTIYTFPSTIPTIPNIEVSPGSVSIFSANDLSNYITPEDNLFNTVTIASRVGFDNIVLTPTTTTEAATSTMESTTNTESTTVVTTTEMVDMTTMVPSATTTDSTTISTSTMVDTTTILSTTVSEDSTTMLTTTTLSSNQSISNSSANTPTLNNRSGKILSNDVGAPIGNSIDVSTPSTTTSTTPDYFIFAVLNNNTILRKRPPTIPNKDTPFIIVGLYPNNTVVRKFPNGTLVPMEQIIKVRGFDIRPNPPPLVEITSNQVTDTTNGMTTLDNNSATVDSNNRMARILANERSLSSSPPRVVSSTTSSTTPSTTPVSSTTSKMTTNGPEMMSTSSSSPSTTSISSPLMSSTTTSETSISSTTTPGTTMLTSTLPSSTTAQGTSTTMATNIVRIMAIPGETRISKAQTTTAEPRTVQLSTTQAPTSTISQSTETIPPTLGEILNGKTVDALTNLISAEPSSTKAPNFKTLQVNQNSITSTTTEQSTTTELPTENDAPFTSSLLSTESTTQFPSSSETLLSSTLISTLMPESTTQQITTTSTTQSPTTTTTTMRTTTPEIKTTTQKVETTTAKLRTTRQPQVTITVPSRTSTTAYPTFLPSTMLPTIISTLFPNLLRGAVTTRSSPISTTRTPFTSQEFSNSIGDKYEVLSTAGTTARPTTVLPPSSTSQRISTTTPPTTTTRQTTTQTTTQPTTTTTTQKPTTTTTKPRPTTAKVSKSGTPVPTTKEETDALFEQLKKSGKLKDLNEEQRKNLEEIERIEKEQAELLKQLTLLTTMFGGQTGQLPKLPPLPNNNPVGGNSNSLANRIIAMAMERDRSKSLSQTTDPPTTTTKKPTKATKATTKRPNSIQDKLPVSQTEVATQKTQTPSLEDVLKQYNLNGLSTPTPLTSTYGKTDEALLAAILKEQGIGPTTPKTLGDKVKEAGLFEENPTTKAPKPKPKPRPRTTTTARPIGGRLMQGLNWLLDILDPPTTKKPAPRRPKAKAQPTQQSSGDEELLTNQPTRITPIVTAAPVTRPNLSQEEIQVLIKQLEAVQNDPHAADQLDFSKIKNLQNLINVNEGVQVTSAGQHGATSRATPRPPKIRSTTEKDPFLKEINKKAKSSTVSTLSVSNSIDDDVELIPTTVRTRVLPPVSLNPIPGIDNQGDSLIRSNLLTAAVNVTRAISNFLGSAIQGASRSFRSLMGSGSSLVGNIAQTSSAATG